MIYIASDHAGFELKNNLAAYLKAAGREVEDLGPFALNPEDDYPDYVYPCAQKVANFPGSFGIVIGGSGQGEAMLANKVKGIKAVLYYGGNEEIVRLSRRHNDANMLSLGARFLSAEEAQKAVDLWLQTGFEGGRHQRRLAKVVNIECK